MDFTAVTKTGLIDFPSEVLCVYVFVDCILLQFSSIKQRNIKAEVFFGRMIHRSICRNHDSQN